MTFIDNAWFAAGGELSAHRILMRYLLCFAHIAPLQVASTAVEAPEDYVNILAGTHGSQERQQVRSTGNTLPIVARPWGFNHWAPQTTKKYTSWWFDADSEEFHGIRCTHQPSPWIGDWGWFLLQPGGEHADTYLGLTSYQPIGALRPYLLDLQAGPHGVSIQLTPTMHGAFMRVTFPTSVPLEARRVCAVVPTGGGPEEDRAKLAGVKTAECQLGHGGFDLQSRRFTYGIPKEEIRNFSLYARVEASNTKATAFGSDGRTCCLDLLEGETQINLRIGTSLISATQARLALKLELGTLPFDKVVEESRITWRSLLSRVHVADAGPFTSTTHQRLGIFYTGLYRALLFPRRLDEDTPDGKYHYSPFDGKVHRGIGVADNGFWDTFRTVYPLLTLAYPRELGELLEGWVNAYRAGGWIPQWSSPGYRGSMCGVYGEVVLADAILKNISGFDQKTAWEALKKEAFNAFPNTMDTTRGRHGFAKYVKNGYASGTEHSCSETLDLAHADAAVASVAARLGYNNDAAALRERSLRALRHLYKPETHLMQEESGKNFDATAWGRCWAEGSSWQYSFPPFNMSALLSLHGGKDPILVKLKELFSVPYGKDGEMFVHERHEMQILAMGQYAHNNQPVHHLPYLFSLLGDHNETARLVRKILSHAYTVDGYSGDEDNGEMGAWYVLSALGLYATAVGTSEDYVLGAVPLFPRVHLRDLDLVIEAPSAAKASPPVVEVLWRSWPVNAPTISYAVLRQGGVLRFVSVGDSRFGQLVSSLRGVAHDAAKRGDEVALMMTGKESPWFNILAVVGVSWLICYLCIKDQTPIGQDCAGSEHHD